MSSDVGNVDFIAMIISLMVFEILQLLEVNAALDTCPLIRFYPLSILRKNAKKRQIIVKPERENGVKTKITTTTTTA